MARLPNVKSLGVASFLTVSATIGAPLTAAQEGISLVPYYDSVGVKTWCRGETEAMPKASYTMSECDLMYNIRYGYYSYQTTMLYSAEAQKIVTPEIHAAMTDMSYNIGLDAVKNSSMISSLNQGQGLNACLSILKYRFAGGFDCSKPGNKVCPGVWTRRQQMERLCEKGLQKNT